MTHQPGKRLPLKTWWLYDYVSKWNARLLRGSLRMCVDVCYDQDRYSYTLDLFLCLLHTGDAWINETLQNPKGDFSMVGDLFLRES